MDHMTYKKVILGGGCFWCIEAAMEQLRGVISCNPGYAGGHSPSPTYEEVCRGRSGHAEVVKLEYDSSLISLSSILDVFFSIHDPCSLNKQGNDVGTQYRSAIYYDREDKDFILEYVSAKSKEYQAPIVTELREEVVFYPAEAEHMRYFSRNSHVPYCQFVIVPKVEKVGEKFKQLLKK